MPCRVQCHTAPPALGSCAPRARAALSALVLGVLLGTACVPKLVGTRPTTLEQARAEVEACALSANRLSDLTRESLALFDLRPLYDQDPRAALRALHAAAVAEPSRALLFALAEGHYLLARRTGDRDAYLAAAVYAYLHLVGDEDPEPPNPYDRRFHWAVELYNDGLLRALLERDGTFLPRGGSRTLVTGRIDIGPVRSPGGLVPEGLRLEPADRFVVEGLRLRLRDSGLGVPLIGSRPRDARPTTAAYALPKHMPVTAFLRLEGGLTDLEPGLGARLELHSGYDDVEVRLGDLRVPLETDRSAALAHALDDRSIWNFSFSGLFEGQRAERQNRLILAQPYRRGRVPVVFVHGTFSSPAYWAEMFNTLWSDPLLRERAQVWFFQYATGNPVLYSAAELRDALRATRAELDPEESDEALQHMVVIGHSQGGLLLRVLVGSSAGSWSPLLAEAEASTPPPSPEDLTLLRRVLAFEPVPEIERAVFVCTPHRGSPLSESWYGRLTARLVSFPREVLSAVDSAVASLRKRGGPSGRSDTSSIASMAPDSQFIELLARTPIAAGVTTHSIIAIGDAAPDDPAAVRAASDGVVTYASAHLEGVASEDLVPGPHSCQEHTRTIQAVRRILREHVQSTFGRP
ncbi:MAG TPA: hypothetical protein VF530_09445 [Planctomycetota bacterium]